MDRDLMRSSSSPSGIHNHNSTDEVEDGYEYQSNQVKDILPAVDFGEDDDFETFFERLKEVSGFPPNTFFLESHGTAFMPGAIYMGFTPPI